MRLGRAGLAVRVVLGQLIASRCGFREATQEMETFFAPSSLDVRRAAGSSTPIAARVYAVVVLWYCGT
ncbi:hypothetical protein MRX96_017753 [Rhipicephalus microplus]